MNYFRCDGVKYLGDDEPAESRYAACWYRDGLKLEAHGPSDQAAREALRLLLKENGLIA